MNFWLPFLESVHHSLFYQLAAILIVAGLLGFVFLKLRQPLIVAFTITGLLMGPAALHLIPHHSPQVETLSALGIALLLFMVGLKLDLGLIRALGPAACITGLLQVGLTALAGMGIALALGFAPTPALCLGIALAFSSTIIVVKLLSDKGAIDSLYGKMSVGILIAQDIVVILSMVVMSTLASPDSGAGALAYLDFVQVFAKLGILLLITTVFVRYLATPLTDTISRSPELMVIFAIGLAAILAAVCHFMGLSKELGGLLAGVALASTPYRDALAARLSPLRDFLLVFFFVGLGVQMDVGGLGNNLAEAAGLSLFVLIGKPVIIMAIMGVLGYRKRTGFMTGMTLAQVSEFSLIFIAMAYAAGLVGAPSAGTITLVGIITMAMSPYFILYGEKLYDILEKPMQIFERRNPPHEEDLPVSTRSRNYDVLIFGMGRFGTAMAQQFTSRGAKVLGIDFDPGVVHGARRGGVPIIYGDAADPEFLKTLPLQKAHTVVLGFPHVMGGPLITDARSTLASVLRDSGYKGHIAATSHGRPDDEDLSAHGIDIILHPFEDAAMYGANRIFELLQEEKR